MYFVSGNLDIKYHNLKIFNKIQMVAYLDSHQNTVFKMEMVIYNKIYLQEI